MKKIIIILSSIILISYIIFYFYFRRTPERILSQQFNIDIVKSEYTLSTFKEQWDYNGDGYCLIIFKVEDIKHLTDIYGFNKFKKMPIVDSLSVNKIPRNFVELQKGLYCYKFESDNLDNFKILIIDYQHKEVLLYYQIM